MSVQTTYTCDRCGAKQDTHQQFWNVAVRVWSFDSLPTSYDMGPKNQWCRSCCEMFGILPHTKERTVITPEPTIEDLIREIVRQEVADGTDD